jgi:ribosomal protein S16
MIFLVIKLKPKKHKGYVIFRIEVHKILGKGKTTLIEKIGYYDTDPFHKNFFIKSSRLGF